MQMKCQQSAIIRFRKRLVFKNPVIMHVVEWQRHKKRVELHYCYFWNQPSWHVHWRVVVHKRTCLLFTLSSNRNTCILDCRCPVRIREVFWHDRKPPISPLLLSNGLEYSTLPTSCVIHTTRVQTRLTDYRAKWVSRFNSKKSLLPAVARVNQEHLCFRQTPTHCALALTRNEIIFAEDNVSPFPVVGLFGRVSSPQYRF